MTLSLNSSFITKASEITAVEIEVRYLLVSSGTIEFSFCEFNRNITPCYISQTVTTNNETVRFQFNPIQGNLGQL